MPEQHSQDHDLLIRLDEKVGTLIEKVGTLTDDHEKRLRAIEKWVWKAIGALAISNILIVPIVIYLFLKILK